MSETKSVLDAVPVKITSDETGFFKGHKPSKSVVSMCPSCGSPIYGDKELMEGCFPEVVFSCSCREARKNISDMKETKG